MKYCIVTMNFNNYEIVKDPLEIDRECDYICITDDKNFTSDVWKTVYFEKFDTQEISGVKKTMLVKHNLLFSLIPDVQKYDYILRVDGSIQIAKSLRPIAEFLYNNNYDLGIAVHPFRNNFMDEYYAWYERTGNPEYVYKFVKAIDDYNYNLPGLVECTVMFYKNTDIVRDFMRFICKYMNFANDFNDPNDQCYVTYAIYKYKELLNIHYHNALLYRRNGLLENCYMYVCYHGTCTDIFADNIVFKENANMFNKNVLTFNYDF